MQSNKENLKKTIVIENTHTDIVFYPLKGYEGNYEISNTGVVKGIDRISTRNLGIKYQIKGKIIKSFLSRGYATIVLCKGGKTKKFYVHRLVALQFLPNPHNHKCVNHKNGLRADNRIDNIEWCTQKYNVKYKFDNMGYLMHTRKLNIESVLDIFKNGERQKWKKNGVNSALSKKHNISVSGVWDILKGVSYKEITQNIA